MKWKFLVVSCDADSHAVSLRQTQHDILLRQDWWENIIFGGSRNRTPNMVGTVAMAGLGLLTELALQCFLVLQSLVVFF